MLIAMYVLVIIYDIDFENASVFYDSLSFYGLPWMLPCKYTEAST